ncbi:MAG: amino acid racemase [Treponema sp.]|nr:amino acid racemase [Treponema sp.]
MKNAIIGVIGGIGPCAGLDFMQNIFNNTRAAQDQDHLDCVLVSCPSMITDRTGFLLSGGEGENPALGMFESAKKLHAAGAAYAVAACNTAHAGRIFKPFCQMVHAALPELTIINMLETCADYVKKNLAVKRIGLLATRGTHTSRVYHEYFGGGFELLEPDEAGQERVHQAIYSAEFGIKACSQPVKPQARETVEREICRLAERGAQAVILGCTELPLAVHAAYALPVVIINPALIAARALIALVAPEKLLGGE